MRYGLFAPLLVTALGCATAPQPSPDSTLNVGAYLSEVESVGHAPVEARQPSTQTRTIVLRGGTVLTADGRRFAPGFVVVKAGRIEAVGGGDPGDIPNAAVVDTTGQWVTPGLIDTHSHLGVYADPSARAHSDGNEATSPTTAGVWAEHAFWPQDPGIERALMGGVTTIHVLPGSANLIGGRSVTLRTIPARGSRAMRFPGAKDGLKMACGENPKRVYGGRKSSPSTRMGNVHGQRAAFAAARDYVNGLASKGAKDTPARNLGHETLAAAMRDEILVQVHCYRADDMLNMIQLSDEFGFKIRSFHHATSAYKIRDILAAREISVSTWADWWGFKLEAHDAILENLALISASGARAVVHSDSARDIQRLNQEAAKAYYAGLEADIELTEDEALRWITLNPAWTLGLEDEVGSITVGKRADMVVWDKHPFSVYSSARLVFVDGELRYDASRPQPPWSDFELGQGGAR